MPAAKVAHYDLDAATPEETKHPMAPAITNEEKSEYERVLHNLHNDPRWIKEIHTGRRVGFYRFRGDLGQGNFSTVKLAHHQLTLDKVAVKVIEKTKLDHKTHRMLSREIVNMDIIAHPNIIRMFEVVETLSRIHLVLEFAPGGELFNKVSTEGRLGEFDASGFFRQVLSGITYLHEMCIIHRDIKAENVFLAGKKLVKLGDFGFSTKVSCLEEQLSTFCGSPPYAAPELYKDESYAGPGVDIWAMGVLLFFLLTADMPFKAGTVAGLKRQILGGSFLIPSHVSDKARDLINQLMVQDPKDRIGLSDISSHPWLEGTEALHRDPLPNYVIYPRACCSEGTSREEELTEPEAAAMDALDRWGVSKEALLNHGSSTGARSPLVATYRIYIHKLLKAQEKEEEEEDVSRGTQRLDLDVRSGKSTPSGSLFQSRSTSPKKYRLNWRTGLVKTKKLKSRACLIL